MKNRMTASERPAIAGELELSAAAPRAVVPDNSDTRQRMLKLAERLYSGGTVSSAWIQRHFGVSFATAKRDLVVLEATLPVRTEFAPGPAFHGKGPRVKLLTIILGPGL